MADKLYQLELKDRTKWHHNEFIEIREAWLARDDDKEWKPRAARDFLLSLDPYLPIYER